MQLYDKDLLSVQEVRELVEKAKVAQMELSRKSQQEVDKIVKSIAYAGVRNAFRLAKMANEDTGFGRQPKPWRALAMSSRNKGSLLTS